MIIDAHEGVTALSLQEQRRQHADALVGSSHSSHSGHASAYSRLQTALQKAEFRLYFQPQIDLHSGAVSGFEALVRWQDPSRGLVLPQEFITIAEQTGLIVPLGLWVLDEACRQAVEIHRVLPRDAPLPSIAVNLSARQLSDPALVDDVKAIMVRRGVRPSTLWLEITETALLGDVKATARVLREFRRLGVHLAIDDFGTGWSSLSHLKQLPVDMLKIDRSFVDGLTRNVADGCIITAVIDLAHSLGKSVVAEGVTSTAQLDVLRALGCDLGQGYLWSKPMPAADVMGWLGAWPGSGILERTFRAAKPSTPDPAPVSRTRARRLPDLIMGGAGPDQEPTPQLGSALRQLLRAGTEDEVIRILQSVVRSLGGDVEVASTASSGGLPIDLSLGRGEPLIPVTTDDSVRAALLSVLRPLVHDARTMVDRLRHLQDLSDSATEDALTGLPNRDAALRALGRLGPGDWLAIIDIDGLRSVNSRLGFDVGDGVLCRFGQTLRTVASRNEVVCRLGATEFVWLMPAATPIGARLAIERLRRAWRAVGPFRVGLSVGLILVESNDPSTSLRTADQALCRAKGLGGDTTVIGPWFRR